MACYFLSLSDGFNMVEPTVLVGSFIGELVMYSDPADLHSVASHFMTQAHVQIFHLTGFTKLAGFHQEGF